MSTQLPASRQTLGRTFVVSSIVLGLLAVAQVAAIGVKIFQSAPADSEDGTRMPPAKIDISKLIAEMPPPEDPGLPVSNDPLQGDPVAVGPSGVRPVPIATPVSPRGDSDVSTPGVPQSRPFVMGRPTPVPLSALTPKVSPQFTELIEQGKLLRNSGDTAGALTKFREAAALEPMNAQAIAEQAYTYEKMSLPDKAAEQWRRVLAFGEGAGVLYSAAQSKFQTAMANTIREVAPAGPKRVLAEGKIVGLGSPIQINDPDPASEKKFILQVPIMARPGQKVSVPDMKVFVLFYDRLNGQDIASTAANVSNRWGSPPADWSEGDVETLEVSYDLPPNVGRGERREYFGYLVRLYYQNELQDTLAEPAMLAQKFPAAQTLSE